MSNYLFRLEVPADKCSFNVAEALKATSAAIHPDSEAKGPVMVQSIEKVARGDNRLPASLNEDDWNLLRRVWAGMVDPVFPMPLEQWRPYLSAFEKSPERPDRWSLSELLSNPEWLAGLGRVIAEDSHRAVLETAVKDGAVALRNKTTGRPSGRLWPGNADSWLLTRGDMKAFFDLLSIELADAPAPLPHFITSARPLAVPPELLALPSAARISYESNIGEYRGQGVCSAGEYRAEIEATIARQAEGYFTLDEAAQVLADHQPGVDAAEAVRRFRVAHAKGELRIHKRDGRFPLEVGETVRSFWDLLREAEIDEWLRVSVGHGFPSAGGAGAFTSDARSQTPLSAAVDRGRRVKREALVADNIRRRRTIERDLKDAAKNGLSRAARDDSRRGWYWEGSAVEWARVRGPDSSRTSAWRTL